MLSITHLNYLILYNDILLSSEFHYGMQQSDCTALDIKYSTVQMQIYKNEC